MQRRLLSTLLAALVLMFLAAAPVKAALMTGHRVGFQWYFTDLDRPYDPPEVLIPDPIASLYIVHSQSTLTLSDDRVTFTSSLPFRSYFNGAPFNGFVLTDLDGLIPDFEAVEIDPASNLNGLTPSRLTLTDDSLAVNLQYLDNFGGMSFSLVLRSASVPEPSTLAMLTAALLAIAGLSRRRHSSPSPAMPRAGYRQLYAPHNNRHVRSPQ